MTCILRTRNDLQEKISGGREGRGVVGGSMPPDPLGFCVHLKKVRYAYQEWPHPADTASPHSQKVERRRQHGYTIKKPLLRPCVMFIG
jgi:hypothetical protein